VSTIKALQTFCLNQPCPRYMQEESGKFCRTCDQPTRDYTARELERRITKGVQAAYFDVDYSNLATTSTSDFYRVKESFRCGNTCCRAKYDSYPSHGRCSVCLGNVEPWHEIGAALQQLKKRRCVCTNPQCQTTFNHYNKDVCRYCKYPVRPLDPTEKSTKQKGDNMSSLKLRAAVTLANADLTTIGVSYTKDHKGEKLYTFKVTKEFAATLKEGDTVVVEGRIANEYQHVFVVNIHEESEIDLDAGFEYKWAFMKLDTSILQQLKAQEEEQLSAIKKKQRENLREQVRQGIESGQLLDNKSTRL
jgi:hypothetical protein